MESRPSGYRAETTHHPLERVEALLDQTERQEIKRQAAGKYWASLDLVFASDVSTPLDADNVRRSFRAVATDAGLVSTNWTPRELRHSFVSRLSSSGMPIEDISRLVGHVSTNVTEKVYRHELRPVMTRALSLWIRSPSR